VDNSLKIENEEIISQIKWDTLNDAVKKTWKNTRLEYLKPYDLNTSVVDFLNSEHPREDNMFEWEF
jgi:hypothetical protein